MTMMDFTVTHISVYRRREALVQTVQCPWLTFNVSGYDWIKTYLPDGRLQAEVKADAMPYFAINLPGMKIDFRMNENRENWVIMLKDMQFSCSGDSSGVIWDNGAESAILPFTAPVPLDRVAGWQAEFERMREAYLNPTPENSLRVRLGVLNLLRFMIDRRADVPGSSPAEQLKRLMDQDDTFSKSILKLSKSCSRNPDHLRELFKARYRISPLAYRKQRRKTLIMELIANSDLSAKEIAYRTGFKHPSHFCLFFKKEHHLSPGEAIKRFRNHGSQNEAW